MMEGKYNLKSPAVKRIMREVLELKEKTEEYSAQPVDDNLFEWHFTIRGPIDSEFEGGIYHGRIILPPDYPMKPPSIMILTPNGRFETNKKICLSISGHHPESWQPSWSIRTAILAIIGFMPTPGKGAIGSLDYTPNERKILAKKSKDWECSSCGKIIDLLKPRTGSSNSIKAEASKVASEIDIKGDNKETEDLQDNTITSSSDSTQKVMSDPTDIAKEIVPSGEPITLISHNSIEPQANATQSHGIVERTSGLSNTLSKDTPNQNQSVPQQQYSVRTMFASVANEIDIFMSILLILAVLLILRRIVNHCYPYLIESDSL